MKCQIQECPKNPKSIPARDVQVQMLHIIRISLCFKVVAALAALVVPVCVHSTELSVPRSCLWWIFFKGVT